MQPAEKMKQPFIKRKKAITNEPETKAEKIPAGYTNLGHFLKFKPLYNSLLEKEKNRSFELGYN